MHYSVVAVHLKSNHEFSKEPTHEVELMAGLGVKGDAHCGATVKHRSRVAKNPDQPNLRQVHLIHEELLTALGAAGFDVQPGQLGENITTRGLDLLGLSEGAQLKFGDQVVLRVTGLRNPCYQIDEFKPGLLKQVLGRTENGDILRKTGVMCTVEVGGVVEPGDAIVIGDSPSVHAKLEPV